MKNNFDFDNTIIDQSIQDDNPVTDLGVQGVDTSKQSERPSKQNSKKARKHNSYRNDRFNESTPQERRFKEKEAQELEDGEETESYSGGDYSQVYRDGIKFFLERDYCFKPVQGGKYCDHEVFKLVGVPSHFSNGYNPDGEIKVFVPLDDEDDIRKFNDVVIDFIDSYHSPKLAGKFWNVVYSPTPKKGSASKKCGIDNQVMPTPRRNR